MKKISLKNLNLKEVEKLSREQLKNVLGGSGDGTGTDGGTTEHPFCNVGDPCWAVVDGVSTRGTIVKNSAGDCLCATVS